MTYNPNRSIFAGMTTAQLHVLPALIQQLQRQLGLVNGVRRPVRFVFR